MRGRDPQRNMQHLSQNDKQGPVAQHYLIACWWHILYRKDVGPLRSEIVLHSCCS